MIRQIGQLIREIAGIPREIRKHSPHPKGVGPVVEIGSGQSPHPRADLVIDKYVVDDFERPGGSRIDFSKPMVVADGQALPLRDRAASYVIAQHVLEHVTNPGLFASELSRVGTAGFVQVPTRESELTFGWPFHPWLIDRDGDTLVFHAREREKAPIGGFFHELFERSPLTRLWWFAHRSVWHHSIEWEGTLGVRVVGESSAEATAEFDLQATMDVLAKSGTPPIPESLIALLVCPVCRGELEFRESQAECRKCGRIFPVSGRVPVLIANAASMTHSAASFPSSAVAAN